MCTMVGLIWEVGWIEDTPKKKVCLPFSSPSCCSTSRHRCMLVPRTGGQQDKPRVDKHTEEVTMSLGLLQSILEKVPAPPLQQTFLSLLYTFTPLYAARKG
jgi:hypothetical protein